MSGNRTAIVTAPAKINLGLEILGKRADGYHEIRTILAGISLADTIHLTVVPDRIETRIAGVPGVLSADNLIQKAIDAFAAETGILYGYDVEVDKHIPSPGGLGGASSDAASTLMALNAIHDTQLPTERMTALAARLGSDVPFFIGPPVALASGTGTRLEPLPTLRGWVILIVPKINIAAKTATLYSVLRERDFTNGERVAQTAQEIRNRFLPDPELLGNAFTRPLYEMEPRLSALADRIIEAGAPHLKLSGAGPGHYVLLETEQEARAVAGRLQQILPDGTVLKVVSTHTSPTSVAPEAP